MELEAVQVSKGSEMHGSDHRMVNANSIHLKWDDLSYFVTIPKKKDVAESKKQILHQVSGEAKPGEMVAIMGASGAGKTSLLNLLAGRTTEGEIQGRILCNGARRDKQFRRQAAFVEQTDMLFANLTVRETFDFTARLRLPSTLSDAERARIVEEVISELGLEQCVDTLVGGIFVKGVSGGEKRRVSIGVELITHPSLIFLDEPTSGLDSTTAYRVVSTIKRLAQRGRTVVLTIHQPKAKIFNMFDKVILLAEGKTVFFGTPADALAHFDRCGFPCPALTNPADFFLDVITPDGDTDSASTRQAIDTLVEGYKGIQAKIADLDQPNPSPKAPGAPSGKSTSFVNSWPYEASVLFQRNWINFSRDKMSTVVALSQSIFIGLLLGGIFFDQSRSQTSVQNRLGVLFFLVTNQAFGPTFNSLMVFLNERPVFNKERQSGSYRVSSYFLAKNLSEFPLQMVPPFVFSVICYWMIGLQTDAQHFFVFCGVTLTLCFTSQSLGLFFGAFVPNLELANVLTPICIVVFMLFGGLFQNSGDVPYWCIWLKWLSYINYGYRALVQNEFSGLEIDPCGPGGSGQCFKDGEEVIQFTDLGSPSTGACVAIMLSMSAFMRICAYFFLRFKARPAVLF